MFEELLAKKSTHQHWSQEQVLLNFKIFMMDKLHLPDFLLTHNQVLKMINLVLPCHFKRLVSHEAQKEGSLLLDVFNENNAKLRDKFFGDELIQYLWSQVFIVQDPDIIVSYVRYVRSIKAYGEVNADKLISDMQALERKYDSKVLPKSPISYYLGSKLSVQEMQVYLNKNGKYNKRYGKQIRKKQRDLERAIKKFRL